VAWHYLSNDMNMVWHHNPGQQLITDAIVGEQRILNGLCAARILQNAVAVP
jgi:hypothetical protein